MQTYSLSRFRQSQPSPPFILGGAFVRMEGRGFLKDAEGLVEILGDFAGVRDGDLIAVEVMRWEAGRAVAKTARRVFVAQSQKTAAPRPHAAGFTEFVYQVRQYFLDAGLSEVFTPSLVVCPGLEPSLEPFAAGERYLPTSPEIHLKKALGMGFTDIFEIKSCFRDRENPPHHAAEFLMLEWYRGFADLDFIRTDLDGLLCILGIPAPNVTTFKALFQEILDFTLTPDTTATELLALCLRLGADTHSSDTYGDLFHRLVLQFIEPQLAQRPQPTVVRDFPPSEAALAKITKEGWADRFELYWRGFEIANAFNEVTDPQEQSERWRHELSERRRLGTSPLAEDPELLEALKKGIPPTGGIALGLERLYMALNGVNDIRELRLF